MSLSWEQIKEVLDEVDYGGMCRSLLEAPMQSDARISFRPHVMPPEEFFEPKEKEPCPS